MRKTIKYGCFGLFVCLCVGIMYLGFPRQTNLVTDSTTISLEGVDESYNVGDIVVLSANATFPDDAIMAHYDWQVVDPNVPNKNFIKSNDGAQVVFGSGSRPGKIKVFVSMNAVCGVKDASGNLKDVSLRSTGISCFDVVVAEKVSLANDEKHLVASRLREISKRINKEKMNVTEAHRAVSTIKLPSDSWGSWGRSNNKSIMDGYKNGRLKTADDYSKFCAEAANKLDGGDNE